MKVKICGITQYDDAQAAIDAGADLLGFNFYPESPRYINPSSAPRLIKSIRRRCASIQLVGVFVNSPPDAIITINQAMPSQPVRLSSGTFTCRASDWTAAR